MALTFALTASVGFATAFGVAVTCACSGLLEVRIVSVRNTVTVGIGVFTVVGVVGELVGCVGLTVTVGVGVVRVGTLGILLGVGQAVSVRVCVSIATVGGVQSVRNLPAIWETIAIAVCIVHVGAVGLLLSVGQTIAVPVGAAV